MYADPSPPPLSSCSNEAATLGALWVNLIVVSGGMMFLIYNELRYRSPPAPSADAPPAGVEMAMSPIL